MKRKPRILFAAFEAVPFMKTGGLGDVAGTLPMALKKAGCEIRVMIPKFAAMPEEYKKRLKHVADFYVPLGWRNLYCGIEKLTYKGVVYYFVDNEYYFGRDSAYGYYDDGERIAFFSKAIVESLQYLPDFKCDILHCNDWHTALSPVFLREFYNNIDLYQNVRTVFTVHNLKFQGQMSDYVLGDVLGLSGIPAANQLRSDNNSVNFMKGALRYADVLTTVSETYAQEIQCPYFGEHMDDIFRARANVLYGIMNGIDTSDYDPENDKNIFTRFSVEDMSGKAACKKALQNELGLEERDDIPLVCMITRLTEQKGMDLVERVLNEILEIPMQVVILGTGESHYEDMLRRHEGQHKNMMCAKIAFDEKLGRRVYAGADLFLMPSLFEPCGLSQMIAMRYGTLPVVRETGGLKDSVDPYNQYTGGGNGFSFANFNAHEMLYTLKSAAMLYHNEPEKWKNLMISAMTSDFGWNRAAEKYMEIYTSLLAKQ